MKSWARWRARDGAAPHIARSTRRSALAEQALVPASASGATLHVTEVFLQYAMDVSAFATAQMHVDLEKQLEQEARVYLEGIAGDARDKLGATIQSHLVRTHPLHSPFAATEAVVQGLGRLVRRLHPDLVVMATHARGRLSRVWLGSVAGALARRGTAPMLLIHRRMTPLDSAGRVQCVLDPLDGSRCAGESLPRALTPASLAGARVVHVQVIIAPAYSTVQGAQDSYQWSTARRASRPCSGVARIGGEAASACRSLRHMRAQLGRYRAIAHGRQHPSGRAGELSIPDVAIRSRVPCDINAGVRRVTKMGIKLEEDVRVKIGHPRERSGCILLGWRWCTAAYAREEIVDDVRMRGLQK